MCNLYFLVCKKRHRRKEILCGRCLFCNCLYLFLNHGLLNEGLCLLKHFIFCRSADIAAVNVDKRPFSARTAVRDTTGLNLRIRNHFPQLRKKSLHFDVIAFVANSYIVSHGANLLYALDSWADLSGRHDSLLTDS